MMVLDFGFCDPFMPPGNHGSVNKKIDQLGPRGQRANHGTEEQGPLKPSIEYSYDKVGRIKTITATANGSAYYTTEYFYYKAGNVVKIVDPFEGETDFQIDEVNRITQRTLPNNLLTIYGHKDTMKPLAAFQDKDKLVRSIDHKFGGTSQIQLTYQRKPGGETQIIQCLGGDFSDTCVNLLYGNLTHNDQLKTAGAVTDTYDAMGRRVKAVESTTIRHFSVGLIPSGLESPLLITDENGNLIAGFVYHGDRPLMRFTDGAQQTSARYYLENAMGSVVGLANQNGAIAAEFGNDAFGKLLASTDEVDANPPVGLEGNYRFHGHWSENSTQLYHMRARDYDPVTGRFLTRDPVEGSPQAPETFNPYVFANHSPQYFSDPTGTFTVVEINAVNSAQSSQKIFRAGVAYKFKEYVRDTATDVAFVGIGKTLELLLPEGIQKQYMNEWIKGNPQVAGNI